VAVKGGTTTTATGNTASMTSRALLPTSLIVCAL